MNKTITLILLVLFLAVGITAAWVFSKGGHAEGEAHHHNVAIISEREFLEHMIPHHKEAVETAGLLLEQGSTLRPLRELVESIIVSQTAEIEDMTSWYQLWYETSHQDQGNYKKMMRSREGLSPDLRDRTLLEDMIIHHEAAIASARQVLELPIHPETEALATSIITNQENEVRLMNELILLLPE